MLLVKSTRNILYLIILVLPLLNVAGNVIPSSDQVDSTATEISTASAQISSISSPQETQLIGVTESVTPAFIESPTATIEEAAATATIIPVFQTPKATTNTPAINLKLSGEFVFNEILISFRRRATPEAIKQCFESVHVSVDTEIEELTVFVVKTIDGSIYNAIAALSSCPDVKIIEPNYLVKTADTIPTDVGLPFQYGLTNIRAPQGWDITTGASSVTIAIIDSGVELNHPDLSAKIVSGYDFVNNDSSPQDDNGHGTHVAGIAAASSNNGTGITGVSWGARIMPIKVLDAAGNGTYAVVSQGIIWATNNGAQIINLSLGGNSPSQILQDGVDYASSRGVIVVAASGNSGSNFVLYPAHYPNVIAVAATDSSNTHAGFSNYGPEVDVSAPGVSIYSTQYGSYSYRSGTSMAAPFVAGLAAVLRGIPGNGSPAAIIGQIESTALDLGLTGWDDFYGYGLIQMDAAIKLVIPLTATSTLTLTPASSQGYAPLPYQSNNSLNPVSFTPSFTPTWTPVGLSNQTAAFLTFTPSTSETSEVNALSIVTPTFLTSRPTLSSKLGNDWPLGCWGLFLILIGILLFWRAARKKRTVTSKITF